jgi:hypothetical protein
MFSELQVRILLQGGTAWLGTRVTVVGTRATVVGTRATVLKGHDFNRAINSATSVGFSR